MKLSPLFFLLLLNLAACSDNQSDSATELSKVEVLMTDVEALARGEALFRGTCANYCHSIPGEDTPGTVIQDAVATFLFDCQWQQENDNDSIFTTVTTGIAGTRMVGFGSNFPGGQDDLWKIIAYLRSNTQQCDQDAE